MPPGPLGARVRRALLGAGSEIWSAPSAPVQHAAALAFAEPRQIAQRIAASRALHGQVAAAVARVCASAGLIVPPPQAGFYVYPDFETWRDHLSHAHQVTTSAALARLLRQRYGAATLPGSAFGEPPGALRLRLATALLYGDTAGQQEAALVAPDPTTLPPIAAALTRLSEILTDLANPAPGAPPRAGVHNQPIRQSPTRDQPGSYQPESARGSKITESFRSYKAGRRAVITSSGMNRSGTCRQPRSCR